MNILIVDNGKIPAVNYGGTERVIWYLGKELLKLGHQVSYLVKEGSTCDFAKVIIRDNTKTISSQIPSNIDVVQFNFSPKEEINIPHIITVHGNSNDKNEFDKNSVFVSKNHAERFGSTSYVYNGLDWSDYGKVDLNNDRKYFHFLAKAAWRVKNVKGAIAVVEQTPQEKLHVVGGTRLNISMGFRFTTSARVRFHGMLGGQDKLNVLQKSKGLIFPVLWNEPFGLSIVESLYFGCPVFATPYGSLPEIVNKEVGFLSAHSSELAEAIQHSSQYDRKKCHDYAIEFFNSATMAKNYLQKYELVLNGKKLNEQKPQLKLIQNERFLPWD